MMYGHTPMTKLRQDRHARSLSLEELDSVSGGKPPRDRVRDAVLDLLRKMSEIKGLY
jgi:hypothetical protein